MSPYKICPAGGLGRRVGGMSLDERRAHRSEDRSLAMKLMLDACRAKGALDALVVCDESGLLVAASTTAGVDPRALAAALPAADRRKRFDKLCAIQFRMEGARLYVGALGGQGFATVPLCAVMHGARRILASA